MLSDDHGEYRVTDTFVRTWTGPHAGWCRCEVREYTPVLVDGKWIIVVRVVAADPHYVHNHSHELEMLFNIYRSAEKALMSA